MKKVYVLTCDDEYEGLLFKFKAYPTREKAEQAVEEYINSFPEQYREQTRRAIEDGFGPIIHELEMCY